MAFDAADQARLTRAAQLAFSWHADQFRKGSEVPYASHLLQVAGLVLEHGGDVDQAVAGFLHDSLEDARSPEERSAREEALRDDFGEEVLRIVLACTDTAEDEFLGNKAPWKQRKSRYLDHLRHADARSALVGACDKRHNLGAFITGVRTHGVGYFGNFRAGAADQLWYFESVVDSLRDRVPRRLAEKLKTLLTDFRRLVG